MCYNALEMKGRPKGQGLSEYLLVTAVVVVLLVTFAVAFKTVLSDTTNVVQEQSANAVN